MKKLFPAWLSNFVRRVSDHFPENVSKQIAGTVCSAVGALTLFTFGSVTNWWSGDSKLDALAQSEPATSKTTIFIENITNSSVVFEDGLSNRTEPIEPKANQGKGTGGWYFGFSGSTGDYCSEDVVLPAVFRDTPSAPQALGIRKDASGAKSSWGYSDYWGGGTGSYYVPTPPMSGSPDDGYDFGNYVYAGYDYWNYDYSGHDYGNSTQEKDRPTNLGYDHKTQLVRPSFQYTGGDWYSGIASSFFSPTASRREASSQPSKSPVASGMSEHDDSGRFSSYTLLREYVFSSYTPRDYSYYTPSSTGGDLW